MATTLYLIRHGATEGNSEKRYKGSIDVPISQEGLEQVRRSAEFIRGDLEGGSLSAVYASPLSRAYDSAELIAAPFGLSPIVIAELKERNFGIWEGMALSEIHEKYPDAFRAWAANPLEHSPLGGESTIEVRERIVPTVEGIVARHRDEDIAIVAHGGVNRVILCHCLCVPLEHLFRIEQDNAAVNIIKFYEKYPVVKLINGGPVG
jgi:broad specificity phosphatase PhoE